MYLLSLNLGSSYPATVNHLRTLRKLSPQAWANFEEGETEGHQSRDRPWPPPFQVWADAWQIGPQEAGRTLHPKVEDALHITLPETPSSGFIWMVEDPGIVDAAGLTDDSSLPTGAFLSLEQTSFDGAIPDLRFRDWERNTVAFGAGGTRHLVLRVLRPGPFTLRLVKRRPWERSNLAEAFEVSLRISSAGTGSTDHGLSWRQQPLMALAA